MATQYIQQMPALHRPNKDFKGVLSASADNLATWVKGKAGELQKMKKKQ